MIVPTTVWAIPVDQVSYLPEERRLLVTRAASVGWTNIDLATGKPETPGGEPRQWMQMGNQLLEVVYQSKTETLAAGGGGLIAFDNRGLPIATGKGAGGWAMTLIGNPEAGPFAFKGTFGGPNGDRIHYTQVVLPNLQPVKQSYFACYDAGPQGVLVTAEKPMLPGAEFNQSDGVLRYLDPRTGQCRWTVPNVERARFWGGSVVAWRDYRRFELFDAKTGRRRRRQLTLPNEDRLIDIVEGDLLVERTMGGKTSVVRLHWGTKL